MGDGARLLNTRQIHDQRGSTGDIDMSTSAMTSESEPVAASALLPAPRQ
jgi:hypothetical protein